MITTHTAHYQVLPQSKYYKTNQYLDQISFHTANIPGLNMVDICFPFYKTGYMYVNSCVCYCAFVFLERTVMYSFNKKRMTSKLSFGLEKSLRSKEKDSSNLQNAFLNTKIIF